MTAKKRMPLALWIFVGLLVGIAAGLFLMALPNGGAIANGYIKPWGTIFLNLLKFIVVPVVLLSMIDGIISMNDMRKVGSVGVKTVVYFLCTTAIACVIGLLFANIFNSAGLFPVLDAASAEYEAKEFSGFMSTLVAIFPTNMWKSFTDANMLQVIVISLFLGSSILAAGERAKLCRDFVSSAYAVIEQLMSFIISLAPIGVFTYMAWVTATPAGRSLMPLAARVLRMSSPRPTRMISTPYSRLACTAPITGAWGALSPPIASTTIFIDFPLFCSQRFGFVD